MKSTTPRRPRRTRRILILAACGVLLWRLCAAWGIRPLPMGGLTDAQTQSLRTLLLGAEVGSLTSEETSLWTALVTTEVPLSVPGPEAEPEAGLSATDIQPEAEVEPEPVPEPEPEPEVEPEPEPEPEAEEETDVVAETITKNSGTVTGGGLELNNSTSGITVDLNALAQTALTQRISSAEEGPQILIMHTHATEAYTMAGEDCYTETDTSRTDDENYNMIRIGEEMKAVFEEMGLSVIHDKTLYDYPSYTGSYARSLAGIQALMEEYPSISVVLDVHRDALIAEDGTVYKAVTQIDGESTAQVMLVVGTNDGGLEHPNWEQNLAVAAHIQLGMEGICDTLARPINLRSQRFNQHMTPCSLLVEVGTSGNTLQEAIRGARCFAQAAGAVYLGLVDS